MWSNGTIVTLDGRLSAYKWRGIISVDFMHHGAVVCPLSLRPPAYSPQFDRRRDPYRAAMTTPGSGP
jgi:hypothetical protein